MPSNLKTRLARLEKGKHAAEERPRRWVLSVGDRVPDEIREGDSVIFLPRKAPSVEAWVEQVRQRWPDLMQPSAPGEPL